MLDTVRFTLQEDAHLIESLQCLSDYDAFTVLKKAISYQFITESALRQTGKQASSMLFNSFLHMVHSTEEHTTDDLALSNTLVSWKFKRMPVASDGNCLFTSVAMALIHHFQSGQLDANITLTRLGLLENDHGNPEAISRALRSAVVDEWLGDNADHYQGFCTGDIRAHAEEYRSSGEFAGDLGDLMVMTVANLIRVPLVLFTNVENMPTMVITPSLSVACTQFPLYLVFNAAGPGHYDYAVPTESAVANKLCTTSKPLKCSCGRKSNFQGVSCSADKLGHCRCPCARSNLPCNEACCCKGCSNKYGQKPEPSTKRRRISYDNQRQQLRGVSSKDYMESISEQVSIGSLSSLEVFIIQAIITFAILNGVSITPEYVHGAFGDVSLISKSCSTLDMPIYVRSLRYIANYLKSIHQQFTLFYKLFKQ